MIAGILKEAEWLPPSHRREYAEYVAEAKKQETRERRAAKIIEMMIEETGRKR